MHLVVHTCMLFHPPCMTVNGCVSQAPYPGIADDMAAEGHASQEEDDDDDDDDADDLSYGEEAAATTGAQAAQSPAKALLRSETVYMDPGSKLAKSDSMLVAETVPAKGLHRQETMYYDVGGHLRITQLLSRTAFKLRSKPWSAEAALLPCQLCCILHSWLLLPVATAVLFA